MKINIIYPYTNLDFPSKMANMIQTLNTCHALAETGKAVVHFILRNPKRWSPKEILDYYGLQECSNLFIHSIAVPSVSHSTIRKCLNIIFKFNLYLKIKNLIKDHPNSLIYARDINVLSLLLRFKKAYGVKFIYEAHSIQAWFFKNWHTWDTDTKPFPKWKSKWYASKENRVLKRANFIVTVNHRLKEILIEEFNIEQGKIYVIPDAAKITPLNRTVPVRKDGKKVIGYAGQLNISRGVDVLIESIMYLDDGVELLIVGGGNEKDLDRVKNLAKKLDLVKRITFIGYIEPRAINDYLSKMDVFTMPHLDHIHSTNFLSPLKMFEYMSLQKPIIGTDLLSTKEVLKNGETAILVKPNDPKALASGIKRLLEDEELANRIADNAYKEVCEKYTWEKRAEKIINILSR